MELTEMWDKSELWQWLALPLAAEFIRCHRKKVIRSKDKKAPTLCQENLRDRKTYWEK